MRNEPPAPDVAALGEQAADCEATTGRLIVSGGRHSFPCELAGPHEWHERHSPPVAARWRMILGVPEGREVQWIKTLPAAYSAIPDPDAHEGP